MKKQILFLVNALPPDRLPESPVFEEGLGKYGLDNYRKARYSDVVVIMDGSKVKSFYNFEGKLVPLAADLVYLRGLANADTRQFIAQYLYDNGVKLINSENLYNMPTSKLNQYHAFARGGVPYPKTACSYPYLLSQAKSLGKLEFPLIVKSVTGKKGEDNHLVKNHQALDQLSKQLDPLQMFAMQPFIENDGDYRIVVYKGKIVICYKRVRADTANQHVNNVGQGGRREIVNNLSRHNKKIAIRAAKVLKRELTGVDLLIGPDGKPYILESNFKFGMNDTGDEVFDVAVERLAKIFHKLAS